MINLYMTSNASSIFSASTRDCLGFLTLQEADGIAQVMNMGLGDWDHITKSKPQRRGRAAGKHIFSGCHNWPAKGLPLPPGFPEQKKACCDLLPVLVS